MLEAFFVGRFVQPVRTRQALIRQPARHGPIREQHALFDELVRGVARLDLGGDGIAVDIEFEAMLDREQVDRTGSDAGAAQLLGDDVDLLEVGAQIVGPLALLVLVLKHRHGLFIGHAVTTLDDRFGHPDLDQLVFLVEGQKCRKRVARLIRHQRAEAVGERLGEHRDDPVDQIDTGAAIDRLGVEFGPLFDEMANVRDVHAQDPAALAVLVDRDRIVEVFGGHRIDGKDQILAQVFALGLGEALGEAFGLGLDLGRKVAGQVVDEFDIGEVGDLG